MNSTRDRRIVLVGRTGVGKSAAGNTILCKKKFESKPSSSSVTSQCNKSSVKMGKRMVDVIDTPGLFETNHSNSDIIKEIKRCISLSSPGPHVFLVIISLGNRFTDEEKQTVKLIQDTFGIDSAKYTMVLFTHGDRLKGTTIEEFIHGNKELETFTKNCPGGYHVFNNEDMENHFQVRELLQKINEMVEKNGGLYYTTEMYAQAEAAIEKEKKKILKENEDKRHREKEVLKSRLKGEALEEAVKQLQEKYEREAREKAERDNSFIKTCAVWGAGIVGVGGGIAGGLVGVMEGAAIGAPAGPAGMLAGAAIGAAGGAAGGAGLGVAGNKLNCSIQ